MRWDSHFNQMPGGEYEVSPEMRVIYIPYLTLVLLIICTPIFAEI